MGFKWLCSTFMLAVFLLHYQVYASPLDQTSIGQDVENTNATSPHMPIQIQVPSAPKQTFDFHKIKTIKEVVQLVADSFDENERLTGVMSGTFHALSNKNILKWKSTLTNRDCDALQGKCQDDSLQCIGSYIIGKCSGPSNIKCCTNNVTLQDTKTCRNVPIYSRDSWGARRPIKTEKLSLPVQMLFIHHTATRTCTSPESCAALLRSIQRFHIDTRKWSDIAYSFLVGQDGRIYESRGWQRMGVNMPHYNDRSLAVSVMGNFVSKTPNSLALKAVRDLLECAKAQKYLTSGYSLYGHRDARATECPGDAFYNLIRTWPHYNTTTDKDGPCLAKHGICKPNYLPCSGRYETGLCNGYNKRQCCVS